MKNKKFFIISGLVIILFLTDRAIKYFASSINFGGGFIQINLYKNYAGAFSLPIAGTAYNMSGLILLAIFIFLFYRQFKAKRASNLRLAAYCLIILGGLSNMSDRLYFGYVIDYVEIAGRSFFNLADIMLAAGVAILFFANFKAYFLKAASRQ